MKMLTPSTIVFLWMLHSANGIDMLWDIAVKTRSAGESVKMECILTAPDKQVGGPVDWKVMPFKKDTFIDVCSGGQVRPRYTSRFKLQSNNLIISDVTVDDSGIYGCAVDGGNTSYITQLIVELGASATPESVLPKWAEIVMGVSGTLNLILLGVILGPKRAAQLCRQADQQIEQLQRITEEPGKPDAKKPKAAKAEDDEHGQTKSADSEL